MALRCREQRAHAHRINFVHERVRTAAIAEQHMDGREVLGNDRLRVLPVWELNFGNMPQSTQRNEKVSTIPTIRERRGIVHGPAENLPPELPAPELRTGIQKVAKWIRRTLNLDGCVRVDFRLSADNVPYFLEANPNPEIARSQEFAHAADQDGVAYSELLRRILALGMKRANGVRVVG